MRSIVDTRSRAPAAVYLHIFRVDRSQDLAAAARLLSDGERARADRFVFAVDRDRFTLARAALRRILSRYLDVTPQSLVFVDGVRGKPALPGSGLEFNVSHSHELAVYAVSRDVPVGVDVEHLREVPDALELARKSFTAPEIAALSSAVGDAALALAFLRCWTRKEAVIKATGDGLSHSLDRLEVTLGAEARLISIHGDPGAAASWSLVSFEPTPGYVAAVATPVAPIDLVTVVESG